MVNCDFHGLYVFIAHAYSVEMIFVESYIRFGMDHTSMSSKFPRQGRESKLPTSARFVEKAL
jgi:hypothetical protein